MTAKQSIEQAEKRLDELQAQIEHAGKSAEDALKDLQAHSSPPETMPVPEDLDQVRHYPGLG